MKAQLLVVVQMLLRALGYSTTETDTRAASQRKLAYPDELMRMHEDKQLVFIDNMYPLMAFKTPWFEDSDLKTKGFNLHD